MDEKVTYGSRIKFIKQENQLISHKIYTDGITQVQIHIDTLAMTYKLQDPVSGKVYIKNKKVYTNLEVVQRNAKKALKEFLDIEFEKEKRDVKNG